MRPKTISKLSNSELILLLLSWSSNGIVEGRTRLEKLVYLLQSLSGVGFSYRFVPYHYGPYSRELIEDLGELNEFGLVEEQVSPQEGVIRYDYGLTTEGEQLEGEIERKMGEDDLKTLKRAYNKWKELPTFELIARAKFHMSESQSH